MKKIVLTLSAAVLIPFSAYAADNAAVYVAKVKPTEGNNVQGKITFEKVKDGVRVSGKIKNLTPGLHGFHIHEKGVCEGNGDSAGGHFNPGGHQHGDRSGPERHAGDFGNINADRGGEAKIDFVDKVIELTGPASILGRAVIVHASPDDFKTQPTGNSGARVGCGVISAKDKDDKKEGKAAEKGDKNGKGGKEGKKKAKK